MCARCYWCFGYSINYYLLGEYMRYLKMLINFVFGTHYATDDYVMPSKELLMRNALREYGAKDYWDLG